ncbi:MAG TPA: transglycosylase family protein [Candidatus Nanoarchaeia archaeon]|nr:transglycosylase family protein [Candidatus Nanoarchaeia archaeon]
MRKLLAVCAPALVGLALLAAPAHADQNQTPQTNNNNQPKVEAQIHKVTEGESLSSIAYDNKLDTWRPLWNANPQLNDPDIIHPDDQLTIPTGPTEDRPLPAQTVAPVASSQNTSFAHPRPNARVANYALGSGDIFARIRLRESGGNYAANTGNGYYGAYQYNDGTWGGYGGYRHASDAPPAVQDQKAAETYARRGCSPWPNTCY